MKKITFVRHGESEANVGGISQPNPVVELTERGKRQALEIANAWACAPSQVYISKFIRTLQTATPLLEKFNLQPIQFSGLNEFDPLCAETIEGTSGNERQAITNLYWEDANPNQKHGKTGQSYNAFCSQVNDFMPTLLTLENNGVIFGHGIWISQLIWQTLGFGQSSADSDNMKDFIQFHRTLQIKNVERFNIFLKNNHVFVQKQ